jgi:hypothetical protein
MNAYIQEGLTRQEAVSAIDNTISNILMGLIQQ